MGEHTTIGDYDVRMIERVGAVVRYAATHVVLPRRAVIELVDLDAPRVDAMRLLRRACILEALQHPAVPRVFECGRMDGRPWIATSEQPGPTLRDELQQRRLDVAEALALLEEVVAFLSHAHSRGVLHGTIAPNAIVRTPTLGLLRWENARLHDTELLSETVDGREDVFALGKTTYLALDRPELAPAALKQLLARMLAPELALRPTAAEVLVEVRTLREALGPTGIDDRAEVDRVIEALADDEGADTEDDCILLERQHRKSVIVDLDACG